MKNTKKMLSYVAATFIYLLAIFPATSQSQQENFYCYLASHQYPAARAMIERPVIDIGFRDDFCTKEIMTKRIGFSYFRKSDLLLAGIAHCGYSKYGELKITLGYGRSFGKKFNIALSGTYIMNHAEHYANRHSFTIDLSALYVINPKFSLAIDLYNPIHLHYGITGAELIPMSFAIQAAYHTNNKLLGYLYCVKNLPGELDIGIGILYQPIQNCIVQGICSIQKCGIGIHIPWKKLTFSIAADWHYRISISPESNIYYTL